MEVNRRKRHNSSRKTWKGLSRKISFHGLSIVNRITGGSHTVTGYCLSQTTELLKQQLILLSMKEALPLPLHNCPRVASK
jgi:hypothetical protein